MPRTCPGRPEASTQRWHHRSTARSPAMISSSVSKVRSSVESKSCRNNARDLDGTLVPFAVRGRRAVDQTVVGEGGHRGIDVVAIHGVAVPLDRGPDVVDRFDRRPPGRAIDTVEHRNLRS